MAVQWSVDLERNDEEKLEPIPCLSSGELRPLERTEKNLMGNEKVGLTFVSN